MAGKTGSATGSGKFHRRAQRPDDKINKNLINAAFKVWKIKQRRRGNVV